MGGIVPLGYDPHPDPMRRELVINAAEAKQVETLFRLYDQLGCLGKVAAEAEQRGLRSKRHHYKSGRTSVGAVLTRGQLHHLLTNPVCLGQIRHKEKIWPGLHPAIIPQDLWDRVQSQLVAKSACKRGQVGGMMFKGERAPDHGIDHGFLGHRHPVPFGHQTSIAQAHHMIASAMAISPIG